ncbi:MAG: hypothetical protein ACQCN3_02725 [Candidatus Bathyarchaeia archaeon]
MENSKTTLSNRLLLLWLLHDAMRFKAAGDTKAHKLAYLAQLEMTMQQEKGLSYDFKKLPFGPYSDDLQADVNWLEEEQLIESKLYGDGKIYSDSKFGLKLLSDFCGMYARNSEFTRKIYATNCKYASYSTYQLVEIVHQQKHPYKNMTIDEAPLNDWILCSLPENVAKIEFTITPEELATLEIYLDEETYKSVSNACYFAQRKPLLRLDEVF